MKSSDFRSVENFLRRKMARDISVEFDQGRNTLVVNFTDVHGNKCCFEGFNSVKAEMRMAVYAFLDAPPIRTHKLTLGDELDLGDWFKGGVADRPLGKAGLKSCFELCYIMHTSWVSWFNSQQTNS